MLGSSQLLSVQLRTDRVQIRLQLTLFGTSKEHSHKAYYNQIFVLAAMNPNCDWQMHV